jgi:sulfate/thiosulfate transport system ATP-binding protein
VLPVEVSDGRVRFGGAELDLASNDVRSGPSKLFVRRHDISIGPAGSGTFEGAVKRVRAFGPTQRADILLHSAGEETLIEIDAPRDGVLKAGDIVGLQPRRYRIFAA